MAVRPATRFQVPQLAPTAVRRNVFTRGLDLNTLIGREFELQGLHFTGAEECRPCYWMDQAVAPGAEVVMRGWGGLRARIRSDGRLRTGVAELVLAPVP
jgi:MOSC domain-containing protein YiiM